MEEQKDNSIFKKIGSLLPYIIILLVLKIVIAFTLFPMKLFPNSDFAAEMSGYSAEIKGSSEIKYEYKLGENDSIIIRKTDFYRSPTGGWQTFPDGGRGYHLIDMVDISRVKNNEVVWQNVAFRVNTIQAPIRSNNKYYNEYLSDNYREISSMGIVVRFGGVWPITYIGINRTVKCSSNVIEIGKVKSSDKFDVLRINLDNGDMKRTVDTNTSELCDVNKIK